MMAKDSFELIRLESLMMESSGRPEMTIGMIDGPIDIDHPELALNKHHLWMSDVQTVKCSVVNSMACSHGTFITGILFAKRGSSAPGICPECTCVFSPIFIETDIDVNQMPSATAYELSQAMITCIKAGARVLNLSVGLQYSTPKEEKVLEEVINYAAKKDVLIVVAAGNQGNIGSSVLTRHNWVIPVVAADSDGNPTYYSNISGSIGRNGLRAPGGNINSLKAGGGLTVLGGTSVAVPFVTGTIALIWSLLPKVNAGQIKTAIQRTHEQQASVVPPLLNAWKFYQYMLRNYA